MYILTLYYYFFLFIANICWSQSMQSMGDTSQIRQA